MTSNAPPARRRRRPGSASILASRRGLRSTTRCRKSPSMRGAERRKAQPCRALARGAAFDALRSARCAKRARLSALHRGSLRSGPRFSERIGALLSASSWRGLCPGGAPNRRCACLRGTPAGTAPRSALKTPLDSAPRQARMPPNVRADSRAGRSIFCAVAAVGGVALRMMSCRICRQSL